MDAKTKKKLQELAEKYEKKEFINKDPSQFMHRYKDPVNQELAGFIASSISFGRREQILSHIELILDQCGPSPKDWLLSGKFKDFFPESQKSFYRMFTFNQMRIFSSVLQKMLEKEGSLGTYIKKEYLKEKEKGQERYLSLTIQDLFPKECSIIPHGSDSASKKLQMFLRWMVRQKSPVDLGLWDWYQPSKLLMPLDTHVMQEATNFNLINPSSTGKVRAASLKTAVELTSVLEEAFPGDPVKGDYALFGLGVDTDKS